MVGTKTGTIGLFPDLILLSISWLRKLEVELSFSFTTISILTVLSPTSETTNNLTSQTPGPCHTLLTLIVFTAFQRKMHKKSNPANTPNKTSITSGLVGLRFSMLSSGLTLVGTVLCIHLKQFTNVSSRQSVNRFRGFFRRWTLRISSSMSLWTPPKGPTLTLPKVGRAAEPFTKAEASIIMEGGVERRRERERERGRY